MNSANYTIKNLVLFEDLRFSLQESSNTTKLEYLYKYENKVSPKSQNPDIKMFLTDEEFLGYGFYGEKSENQSENQAEENYNVIPNGKYMFLQGIGKKEESDTIEKAAETLFLEGLWQEKSLKNTTYLRFLQEGEKTVFQLFREIE